jgi:hypothetical protein
MNLAQKTGDKLIVFDSRNPKNSYVLIPFDEYERNMSGVINDFDESGMFMDDDDDDATFWKNPFASESNETEENVIFDNDYKGESDFTTPANEHLTEDERIDKINRDLSMSKDDDSDEMNFLNGNFEQNYQNDHVGKSRHWSIPKNIKEVAEEVIEEDRHYLEEITF